MDCIIVESVLEKLRRALASKNTVEEND